MANPEGGVGGIYSGDGEDESMIFLRLSVEGETGYSRANASHFHKAYNSSFHTMRAKK